MARPARAKHSSQVAKRGRASNGRASQDSQPSTSRANQNNQPSTSGTSQPSQVSQPSTSRTNRGVRSKQPARRDSSSSDDDPSAMQVSEISQNEASQASSEVLLRLADLLIMHFLIGEKLKRPARRQDITSTSLQGYSRQFKKILNKASEILSEVYGFSVVESDGKFFLINQFAPSDSTFQLMRLHPVDERERVLLLIVLSHIFMEGGCVMEDHMWTYLQSIDIKDSDSYYGEVKKLLIKEMVRRLYLEYKRREGSDPAVFEFSEGVRAKREVNKRDLLAFVAEMTGTSIACWPAHLSAIEREEAERETELSQQRTRNS